MSLFAAGVPSRTKNAIPVYPEQSYAAESIVEVPVAVGASTSTRKSSRNGIGHSFCRGGFLDRRRIERDGRAAVRFAAGLDDRGLERLGGVLDPLRLLVGDAADLGTNVKMNTGHDAHSDRAGRR